MFTKNKQLSFQEIWQQFIEGMKNTMWLEYIAVFSGITSVWFSRIENILVYPVGLVNTIIYIYLSVKGDLYGEASVNFYYTVMSITGWYLWLKKNDRKELILQVRYSDKKMRLYQVLFFIFFYATIFFSLTYLKNNFAKGAIPWADAFASATAFTGMWLMTKKKVESWYWWIATNIASIPLYFVKHYVFTSIYYLVLLIMAVFGLIEWKKRALIK
jgi:nicotinamide mononucleotide transporter